MGAVIEVNNLGKLYRLGKIGTGTLSHDLKRWWSITAKGEDPYAKIGSVNDRTQAAINNEHVWALKDVSFRINSGEVVGIIGKNGAGKSTLLKILSRITSPSVGEVKMRGRVGSLLEVGTGFHPEMTGRENIFMNGTVLGMRRFEIQRKFDEIVDFAGVAKYIDTPVKRYSSGMMVRLGFAVAAFLEPEILIVDEVLAVGDAEFQRKAIGKMQDVSKGMGRTVLFVSHNISAIRALCTRGIVFTNGTITFQGGLEDSLGHYLQSKNDANSFNHPQLIFGDQDKAPGCDEFRLIEISLSDGAGKFKTGFESSEAINIMIRFKVKSKLRGSRLMVQLLAATGEVAFASTNHQLMGDSLEPGTYQSWCEVPGHLLNSGRYLVRVHAGVPGQKYLVEPQELFAIDVEASGQHGSTFRENWPGIVAPRLHWVLNKE